MTVGSPIPPRLDQEVEFYGLTSRQLTEAELADLPPEIFAAIHQIAEAKRDELAEKEQP